jgi:tetratricopeptide (TPR) repeat protein
VPPFFHLPFPDALQGAFRVASAALLVLGTATSGRAQSTEPAEPQDKAMEACYRASAAQQQGRHEVAISFYNQCIAWAELPPETLALVLSNRATSRQRTNDFKGALRDYGEAIEIDPDRANAYNGRCWTYAMLRRPEQALADCEESLRLAPDDPYALDSRALVHWLMSRDELARADLERARALNPSFRPWQERFKDFEKMFFGIGP